MLRLVLPWPPSINNYYTPFVHGTKRGVGLNKRARAYRKEAVIAIRKQLGPAIKPTDQRLSCQICLYPRTHHDVDIDNFNKAIFDAMQHAKVYENDTQIRRKLVVFGFVKPPGCVIVKLRRLPPADASQLTFETMFEEAEAPF